MEYEILEASDASNLEEQVAEKLENNWKLVGGVCLVNYLYESRHGTSAAWVYCQAMSRGVTE